MLNREQAKVVRKITELLRIAAAPYCIACRARMKGGSGRYYCNQCEFGLWLDNPWCMKCRKRTKAFGVTRDAVQRWMCNWCSTTFSGSRPKTTSGEYPDFVRKVDKLDESIPLFRDGRSTRDVMRIVGISNATANKFRRIALKDFDARCKCGEPAGHRGWCWWRFQNHPKRQEFMKRWHQPFVR